MNSNYYKRCITSDKHYHFSIRKLNIGVVSVAISAFMFLSGTVALADSSLSNEPTTSIQATPTDDAEAKIGSEETKDLESSVDATTENTITENTNDQSENTSELPSAVSEQENDSALSNGVDDIDQDTASTELTNTTENEDEASNSDASVVNADNATNTDTSSPAEDVTTNETAEGSPVALADNAETPQDGYSLSEPDTPASDPVEGRYTYEVIQDDKGIQYVFSIDSNARSGADLTENRTARYIYVTRIQDGKVLSSEQIDRTTDAGTKFSYGNTNINLLSGSKAVQIASADGKSNYKILFNALSTSSTLKSQTINISNIRLADQVTKYVNELTGEVIHEEYIQTGWIGYEYTTKPIEIEYYEYVRGTDNANGVVSTAVPRNKGDIVYLTTQSTVTDSGNEIPVRIYRKFEFIDDNQTAKATIYMTPRIDEGAVTDARTFFENMENYNIYNNKVYTSATDLTQKTNSGVTFSDIASNDKTGYYLARPYADTPDGKTPIQVFFETSPIAIQTVDGSVRFTLPYADTTVLYGDGVNNRLSSPNRKAAYSTVVYYYMPQGEVVVNYVDTDGNVIKDPVTDTPVTVIQVDGKPVEYDTNDKRDNTIRTADGKTYKFKEVKNDSAPETGELKQGKQEVTYVYEEVKGDVVVLYRTEDGKELTGIGSGYDGQPDKTVTIGSISDTQTAEQKAWNGAVIDTPASSTGSDYTTIDSRPETITTADGLVYKRIARVGGNETGKVVEGTTRIVYYYEAQKGGAVNARYVIEGTEDELQPPVEVKAEGTQVGTEYIATKPQTIVKDGKTYVLSTTMPIRNNTGDAPESGRVTEGQQTVVYQYVLQDLRGSVTIHYEDEDGNVIKDPVKDEENTAVGTPYDTTDEGDKPTKITTADGKTYELVPDKTRGEEHGTVVEGNTDVTYVYREVKGEVVVNYVDKDGNVIKDQVIDTPSSSTGTDYDTSEHAQKIITTADGKRYILVKAGDYPVGAVDEMGHLVSSDATTGKVAEGTKTVTYVYQELGSYIPYIPQNPGDPYDPTNPGTDEPKVPYDETPEEPGDNPPLPYIPGYTPKDPNGDPLKPVDPDDPTKGYIPPPITDPNDPGKDTPVPYEKDPDTPPEVKQGDVIVKYVNEKGETIAQDVTDTPLSDEGTEYDTTDNKPRIINGTDGKRYIFTKIQDGDSETGKVKEGTTTVTYIYKELGSYIPYIPQNPGDPYDPTNPGTDEPKVPYDETPEEPGDNPPLPYIPGYTPKDPNGDPLKPVDPDDPTKGYIPPPITDPNDPGKDTPVPYEKDPDTPPEVKQGDVIVKYVNEKGETIAQDVTDTPLSDEGTEYDTTDNKPRIINGTDGKRYIFTKIQDGDSEIGKVKEGTTTVTYIYKELGSYIPYIPTEPGTKIPEVPYDETPEEPGDNPPLPYIPGYTPKDPNGDPLKPVDPDDPTKGYIPPPITDPNDPGKDTPVPYEKDPDTPPEVKQGDVIVKYVNEKGETIAQDVTDTPLSDEGTEYDTTDNKPRIINGTDGKRYIFTKIQDGDSETGKVKEGTTTVTYIYKELGSYIPYIPTEPGTKIPEVPYDETPEEPGDNPPLPYIPGYTPKDPNGDPLKPVDPDDPTKGYIPPPITDPNDPGKDTPVPYEKDPDTPPEVKQGDVIVKYVNEKGEMITQDVTDTPLSDEGTEYDTTDNKPRIINGTDGKRYIFTKIQDGDSETGKVKEGTTTVTYIYKELGSYIPYIPTEPGTKIPEVPYDETPEEPGDNPPLPYIPGYTPKDPNGDPLKPVDPDDPTKGYIPPPITDPNDPGKDTPVPYEKDPEITENVPPKGQEPNAEQDIPENGSKPKSTNEMVSPQKMAVNKDKQLSMNKQAKDEAQTLPQTGENDNILGSLGILSLALGTLGLFMYRKQEDK